MTSITSLGSSLSRAAATARSPSANDARNAPRPGARYTTFRSPRFSRNAHPDFRDEEFHSPASSPCSRFNSASSLSQTAFTGPSSFASADSSGALSLPINAFASTPPSSARRPPCASPGSQWGGPDFPDPFAARLASNGVNEVYSAIPPARRDPPGRDPARRHRRLSEGFPLPAGPHRP